jgi:hypothetical protein
VEGELVIVRYTLKAFILHNTSYYGLMPAIKKKAELPIQIMQRPKEFASELFV